MDKRRGKGKIVIAGASICITLFSLLVALVLAATIDAKALESESVQVPKQQEVVKKQEVKTKEDIYLKTPVPKKYQKIAYKYAKVYKLPFKLVVAVIEVESKGKAKVISTTYDYGLMQINKSNHKWLKERLGISDFLNPEDNIKAGCYMLARYMKAYNGSKELSLMSYNLGGSHAEKLWRQGVRETDYSRKVLNKERNYTRRR